MRALTANLHNKAQQCGTISRKTPATVAPVTHDVFLPEHLINTDR